ncbi:MAG: hypothetical protein AAGJ38_06435 [Planctomycetota bacterium]
MAEKPPIAHRRGYALTDLSNATIAYILIKSDLSEAAAALAQAVGGQNFGDILNQAAPEALAEGKGFLVYQLKGHPWCIFAGGYSHGESLPAKISKVAGLEVLVFINEDVSGWSELSCYRGGKVVEKISWGLDYSDEMEEAAEMMEEMGEDIPDGADRYAKWDAHTTIVTDEEMGIKDEVLFKSELRTASESDLQGGEAYVDDLLKSHDAYLPDLDEMLWTDYQTHKPSSDKLPLEAFVGAHAVTIGDA